MLILLERFANFFEVHYKLLQRILQNFNAGGLLSGVGIFSGLLSGGLFPYTIGLSPLSWTPLAIKCVLENTLFLNRNRPA